MIQFTCYVLTSNIVLDEDEESSSDDDTDDDSPEDSEDVHAAVNINFLNEARLIRQNLINSSFLY